MASNPFITSAGAPQNLIVDPEAQGIQRQRQYAAALLGQTGQMPQGQNVSGIYVAPSWTQNLSAAVNPLVGAYMMNKADTKAEQYAKALREEGAREIGEYINAIQGKPEEVTYSAEDVGPTRTVTPAVAPDYNKALQISTRSRSPLVQALGAQTVGEMIKPQKLGEGEQFVRFNPQSQKYETIGGGGPKLTNEIRNYQYDVSQGYKGTFNQWTQDQNRSKAQNINVQNAVPFQEQLYTDAAKALVADYNTLKSIPSQVKQLDRVAQLAPKSFAGSFADTKLQTVKFFNNNLGTNIAPEKVNNTEELRTVLFTNIMDNLKKMDASPSQEQQRIMQASLGNIGTDPDALPKVVGVYKEILLDKAEEHNKRVGQTVEKGFKYPYDITVQVPKREVKTGNTGTLKSPNVGDIQNGWQFIGGNPALPSSWKKVNQ